MEKIAVMVKGHNFSTFKGFIERDVVDLVTTPGRTDGRALCTTKIKAVKVFKDSDKLWQMSYCYLIDLIKRKEVKFPCVYVSLFYLQAPGQPLDIFQDETLEQ